MKTSFLLIIGACCIPLIAACSTAVPLAEHPRPDFQRPAWVNLNGAWQFEFDPQAAGETQGWYEPGKHAFSREIVVPFPWESKLSGIADTQYQGTAWYTRQITLPAGTAWDGRDCWLIIGACDWEAKVWINGQLAAEHVGGYVPIEVNLAPFAKPGDKTTITIRATDVTDRQQPTGKQVGWYTRNSGIWQTVYLEPRAKSFIKSFRASPSLQGTPKVEWTVRLEQPQEVRKLVVSSPNGEFADVSAEVGTPGEALPAVALEIANAQLWSPDTPKLYDAKLTLLDADGKPIDAVNTYFGLREIRADLAPGRDYQYIYLNGKPVYLRGALHQSFHPDGVYQYPSDAAVRSDYELCKQVGINFLRIHIKTPVPRELYWADKLGVMIMQDIPNYWAHTKQSQAWYEEMLPAVIERDFNHPAIFAWIDFNETWGIEDGGYKPDHQEWVESIYKRTKEIDPTRLVEDNSPCKYDHVVTDINSWHFYINEYERARRHIREVVEKTFPGSEFNYIGGRKQGNEPLMNSEYGGIGAGQGDQDISWCFKYLTNEQRLYDKICGYIYTELSDIEWEHNGYVNYDRSPKEYGYDFWFPGFSLADINAPDFVVIDAPPMIVLKPDEHREVPIKISHWSDRAGDVKLRCRQDWIDALGERTNGEWKSADASWEAFKVVDQSPIRIDAAGAGDGIVGALLVEVVQGDAAVARNYVNVFIDRGPLPRVQALDPHTVALRFGPMDFARWSFGGKGSPQQLSADKIAGLGAGAVEYEIEIPKGIAIDRIKEIALVAELASKAAGEKLDWPARTRPVDYPQTDVTKWPSDVSLSVDGQTAGTIRLADDPADARGAMSHHRGYQGSYGYLIREKIDGAALSRVRGGLSRDRTLQIRLEVPSDAAHKGGLAVFGQNVGCWPVEPTILLAFDGAHGLPADHRSNEPVARNIGLEVLLPTAESGRHNWQYSTEKPGDDWASPTFDDAAWQTGAGGFGDRRTPNSIVTTRWNTDDIWLRTTVDIEPSASMKRAHWRIYHDDDAEIHVNGKQVLSLPRSAPNYIDVPLSDAAVAAFTAGRNTIAVHCKQTGGDQNIDVGLILVNAD